MSAEIRDVEVVSSVPAIRERSSVLLMPVMDVNTAKSRLLEFQEFCAHYLQESQDGGNDGGDFGVIPGTKKKTLLKSGADKLCEIYGLYDEYVIISSVEDWDKGLFDYTLKCVLKSRRDDSMVGAGVGSCSSYESKYRWRESKRKCPACDQPTIIKGRDFSGQNKPAGWVCWKKPGKSDGCGATFKDGDKSIEDQIQGRVENPDIIDAKNTVLKMAKKRAKIDGVIGVTRSSGIFTQDLDEIPMPVVKPAVPVTEQDIPLGAPTVQSGAGGKGSAKAPVLVRDDRQVGGSPVRTGSAEAAGSVGAIPASVAPVDAYRVAADLVSAVSETDAPKGPANFYENVKTEVKAMQEKPAEQYPGCIDKGRKVAFTRAWNDALPKQLEAHSDKLRKEWLGRRGYIGTDGIATSAKIPLAEFEQVKKEAVAFARGLKN